MFRVQSVDMYAFKEQFYDMMLRLPSSSDAGSWSSSEQEW
jgi:hypothetical protein